MSGSSVVNSSALPPMDSQGNPIPVVIPIEVGAGVSAYLTTRLGGVNGKGGDACNLSYSLRTLYTIIVAEKIWYSENDITRNRAAIARVVNAPLSFTTQTHGVKIFDLDTVEELDELIENQPHDMAMEESPCACNVEGNDENPKFIHAKDKHVADIQITTRRNVALAVMTADCLPLLLSDSIHGVIATVHCGREGLMSNIVDVAVKAMVSKGASAADIKAVIGPHICADCYEVDCDIADSFDSLFAESYGLSRFGGSSISLLKAVVDSLASEGVKKDNIILPYSRIDAATQYLQADEELEEICRSEKMDMSLSDRLKQMKNSLCTYENPLWHSHRRSQHYHTYEGRFASIIMRV